MYIYFGQCIIFTRKRQLNADYRKTMLKQYFFDYFESRLGTGAYMFQLSTYEITDENKDLGIIKSELCK